MSKRMKALAWIHIALGCGLIAACCSCSQTEPNPKTGSQTTPMFVSKRVQRRLRQVNLRPNQIFIRSITTTSVVIQPMISVRTARAKSKKKNILIQVGGDWCGWCKLMSTFIETDEKVRDNILSNYLVMKVTENGDKTNASFLSQYPSIPGYPHLFVLDSDGKLLHSQGTAELEEGHGYNESVYLEFLNKWKPAR